MIVSPGSAFTFGGEKASRPGPPTTTWWSVEVEVGGLAEEVLLGAELEGPGRGSSLLGGGTPDTDDAEGAELAGRESVLEAGAEDAEAEGSVESELDAAEEKEADEEADEAADEAADEVIDEAVDEADKDAEDDAVEALEDALIVALTDALDDDGLGVVELVFPIAVALNAANLSAGLIANTCTGP